MSYTLMVDEQRQPVSSRAELEDRLQGLHKHAQAKPQLVQLVAADGATMSIGLGATRSVLNYISPGGWPAFTAVGPDPDLQETVTFSICGEESELLGCFAMPFDQAVAGILDFFDTGNLPENFEWRQD